MNRRQLGMALVFVNALAIEAAAAYGPAKEVHLDESEAVVEKKLSRMSKKLDLTPEQAHGVKEALEAENAKLEELKKEAEAARNKILDDTDGALKGILNPAQQEKYASMRDEVIGRKETRPNAPPNTARRGPADND